MAVNHSIQYIRHHEINKPLWDECISNAGNGLIYAYSWYLDAMAGQWDALVTEDYKAVMPLPWRKKYGISYIYQPFLTAQLGVFGKDLDKEILNGFLNAIPAHFKLWEFSLNHGNVFDLPSFPVYKRMNYVLDLSPSYETIHKNFRENIQRNIRKAKQYGLQVEKNTDIENVIALSETHSNNAPIDIDHFRSLFQLLKKQNKAKAYSVRSSGNEILASAAFLFSHNRAYYILVGNHPNGRTLGASHLLVNAFIEDHAHTNLYLDFEGSDIRNLAFFYSGFGAREENYLAIKMNRLPWYMKWLKK